VRDFGTEMPGEDAFAIADVESLSNGNVLGNSIDRADDTADSSHIDAPFGASALR
jgi:hypothetical protein